MLTAPFLVETLSMNSRIKRLGDTLCRLLVLLAFCLPVMIPTGLIAAESEVAVEDVEECVLDRESDRRKQKRRPRFLLRFPNKPATIKPSRLRGDFSLALNGHRIVHDLLAPLAC